MTRTDLETSDLTFHVAPADQGQIVEVAYAADDGVIVRRTTDRSDGSVVYSVVDADECESFEPWNEAPAVAESAWRPVR